MANKKTDNLKLYQVPIDALSLNIAVYRRDGDDFLIVDFNKSAQITENIQKETVVGKKLCEVFPAVKEFGLFEVLERIDKDGGHETFDLKFYEDGRISGWRKNEIVKLPNGDVMAMYENLTKEKQLEDELKQVNRFIDSSQTVVFFWKPDEHWSVEYVSSNVSAWGYKKDDFLSGKIYYEDIIHKEDLRKVQEEVKQHTEDGDDNFVQIYRIIAADGSIHWVDDRTVVERDSVGEITHYLGTIVDITREKSIENKLIQSESQFRTIAESSLMGIFIYIDNFVYVNHALCEMSGFTNKELLNIKPWELVEESLQEPMKNRMSRRISGEHFPHNYDDLVIVCKSGERKIARIMTETIRYKDGYAGLGSLIDITDIQETKQRLKMLAQALEQSDELIMITDAEGVVTYVNDAYIAHTGYRHHELIGKDTNVLNSEVHNKEFFKELWETISSGKTYTNTITNRKKDGQLYYEEVTISPIFDEKGTIQNYISTGRDITPRIKMQEELQLRATTDELTKIYNRYYGNEILDVEIDRVERYRSHFAVLMFDIDKFKLVNDTYGHDIGDKVLERLSQVISIHLRKSDTFVRWGGEEFLVVSAHIEKEEAMKFAQKLRLAIESYEFDSELKITISVGVTVSKTGDTKEMVLKRADDALYKAKESGRNCVKFV